MTVFGIDPGPLGGTHAVAWIKNGKAYSVAGTLSMAATSLLCPTTPETLVAIEKIVGQGRRTVGNETFDTVRAEHQFRLLAERWGHRVVMLTRSKARSHVAGPHAGDRAVRAALVVRFPETKAWTGSHRFAALAVAVTALDIESRTVPLKSLRSE